MKAKLLLTLILSALCLSSAAVVAQADNCPSGVICIITCPGDSCSGN